MAKQDDPVVLKYTPVNHGDFVAGVPPTDITASRYRRIEPVQLHAMTVPGASGKAMYSYVKPPKETTDAAKDAGKGDRA